MVELVLAVCIVGILAAVALFFVQKIGKQACPECGELFSELVKDDQTRGQCRFIPSWMDPPNEDDPYETVRVGEIYYRCPSCNEILDVHLFD